MNQFMKRLAKLRSGINTTGDDFRVFVYDDESGNENHPVMWLDATVVRSNGVPQYVFAIEVNFNDDEFFKLPESRQDRCALVLFRAFIDYYNTNYGRDSGNWLPVYADFANYKLQEKFKQAVEKGIFPPESLTKTVFTSEETWRHDRMYNMDLRRKRYESGDAFRELKDDIADDPRVYYPTLNVQGRFAVNNTITELREAIDDLISNYPFLTDVMPELSNTVLGTIRDGDVYFVLPLVGNERDIAGDYNTRAPFWFIADEYIEFITNRNRVIENVSANVANVRRVFNDVLDVSVLIPDDVNVVSLNDLLSEIERRKDRRTANGNPVKRRSNRLRVR